MKTKGRKSKNVVDRRNHPHVLTAESFIDGAIDKLRNPSGAAIGPVHPKTISDSMENALKADRLSKSKQALDRTVNPKEIKHKRITTHEVGRPDPKDKMKLKFQREVDGDGFERATRHIQVTPGKWNTK